MSEIKYSRFLAETLEAARAVGNRKNPPITAERFIFVIIDKARQPLKESSEGELLDTLSLLCENIPDLGKAKEVLEKYVNEGLRTAPLDDLYMKKRIQKAFSELKAAGENELTAPLLLKCIFEYPSDPILSVMQPKKEEARPFYSDPPSGFPGKGARIFDEEPDNPTENESLEKPAPEETCNVDVKAQAKLGMATLVADVKRIRAVLGNAIYGQDNAINVFATGYFQAVMLSMIDKSRTRPRATFLFAGPPGVGKTFMAEKAAEALGLPFMRFDMSEYNDNLSAAQEFAGYPRSYKATKVGKATGFVDENPKCVLLFDEIEKASISVIHLFLQMLDAGFLRDAHLEKEIPFKDAIIIFTTNAGKSLYESEEISDLSTVSRKVVIKALQKDINPQTGNPYFPAAICSRFASGNVVMFNHINASFLMTIAKKEIERHAENLKKEIGIELEVEEKVYTALLFSEGASVDARTIRGRAESFFNDELYELLRLIASDKVKTDIGNIEKIKISVDLSEAKPEVVSLFEFNEAPAILVFADAATSQICREKLSSFGIIEAHDFRSGVEALKSNEIGFLMLDMKCGAEDGVCDSLNIEDVDSPARDFYRFVREHRAGLPVYLIENKSSVLSDEEKITFLRQGVRGFLHVSKGRDSFASSVGEISLALHRQQCMVRLAKSNKLISFETSQSVSKSGRNAEIKLFDLEMSVAVDSEDSKNVMSALSKPDVKFDDVIGAGGAKKELAYFVEYLKDPKKYIGTGVKPPKGVLLYGPPGTGKTMLAKAMASESDVTFIAAEGNQFLKKYVGEGPEKVHELFKTARKYAPAILFVDEIDAIAKERRGADIGNSGAEETLTAFLTEMDGFVNDATKPVFVLAATNFDVEPGGAKSLDPALMRRFDRRVYIELPDKADRIRFMKMKMEKNPAFDISEEEIENIAMRSTGMSPAELDSAMELALRSAIREGSTKVTDAIFENAFETFNNGDAKVWRPSQLERVARHEAGHAFMCWYCGETPSYLTIVARGNHGGYMQHADNEGKGIYTKGDLLGNIKTALGGRAAELVYYGEDEGISTGAAGDLSSATSIAAGLVCTYGMDSEFGLAVVSGGGSAGGEMSIEVRRAVNRILKEQMDETVGIIKENKIKLDALVSELMNKNHLNAQEIDRVLSGCGAL